MKYIPCLITRLALCFVPLSFFYLIFTPLTLYGTYGLLYFYKPIIFGNGFIIKGQIFNLIDACVAGSAYYLIWVLMLLSKDIKSVERIKIVLIGFLLIYLMNIIRVALLIFIAVKFGPNLFEAVHMIFWKFLVGVYVALVWILLVYIFKIKSIPVYSDLKYLYKRSLLKKKKFK
jgi:exosortase/archaeosortase family protein